MYSLKEKVTEKLSRLLADSPSSPKSPIHDPSKASPQSKGGRPLSSVLASILPSMSVDERNSNKGSDHLEPIESNPVKFQDKSASGKDESLVFHADYFAIPESKESLRADEEFESPVSAGSTSESELFEDSAEAPSPSKRMSNLTEESSLMSVELYEFLQLCLPNIVKGCQWVLLYSTLKHGISLRTLLRKSTEHSGPCILIAGDKKGAVFGGLLQCPLRPSAKRKYQGTNESFVFTTMYGVPRLFRPTGANRYFYMCLNDLLAFGGGGSFALSLGEDLLSGTSGACETFGNECLSHDPEFEPKNVELWGFRHLSRYI